MMQTPYYDESSDTIYLFGGYYMNSFFYLNNYDIYSYSLQTNTLSVVGRMPEVAFELTVHVLPPPATTDNDSSSAGYVYYVIPDLGHEYQSRVYLFNFTDGSSIHVGNIPVELDRSSWAKGLNDNEYFFFGGLFNPDSIYKVILNSEEIQTEEVGKLPQEFYGAGFVTVRNIQFVIMKTRLSQGTVAKLFNKLNFSDITD